MTRSVGLGLAAAATGLPGAALAHGALPGMEGFQSGALHLFREPALLIGALAAALALLPDWPERFQRGIPAALAAMVIGLLAGRSLAATVPLDLSLLGAAAFTAAFTALAGDRLTALLFLPLCGLALLVGAATLPEPGVAGDVAMTTAGGILAVVSLLLILGGGFDMLSTHHSGPVLSIGLRIAAAWLAAIALLLTAFLLRGPPAA